MNLISEKFYHFIWTSLLFSCAGQCLSPIGSKLLALRIQHKFFKQPHDLFVFLQLELLWIACAMLHTCRVVFLKYSFQNALFRKYCSTHLYRDDCYSWMNSTYYIIMSMFTKEKCIFLMKIKENSWDRVICYL